MIVRTPTGSLEGTHRGGFTLVELLVVIAIIGVLIALLLPAVQAAREAARRVSCTNKLKQVGLALHNYHDSFKEFPYGGDIDQGGANSKPGYWAHLLPYFEESSIADQMDYDISLFDPTNRVVADAALDLLTCPSDQVQYDPWNQGLDIQYVCTNYVAVGGAGRLGEQDPRGNLSGCGWFATDGFMVPERTWSFKKITDGSSQTFAIGERIYEIRSWLKNTQNQGGGIACLTNTKTIIYSITNNQETLGWYSADQDRPAGDDRLIPFNHLPFGSRHPGGAHFVYCDGHVEFLSEDTQPAILRNLATINGAEMRENLVEPTAVTDVPPGRDS